MENQEILEKNGKFKTDKYKIEERERLNNCNHILLLGFFFGSLKRIN